ncbi:c-type cytochrome [Effusibacillus pohliae]|uniref:c-type cytochrome n=1 Tax=Effusibacillus pohliae TaxID=232270 RepID=UPI00036AD885
MGVCREVLSVFLLIAGVGGLAGCTPPSCTPSATTQTDLFHTYRQNCAGCHGDQMQGISGPALRQIGNRLIPAQIETVIRRGAPGMPPFEKRLDQKQIRLLVDYLASQK